MKLRRALPSVVVLALSVAAVAAALFLFKPVQHTIMCDGSFPRWMLQAQDYKGGGCAEVFPTSEAPPNADWTMICTAMCIDGDQPPVWP